MTSFRRHHLHAIKLYKSARGEFSGQAQIMLDANEMPWDTGYNRYPNPAHEALRQQIADLRGVKPEQVSFANGSDQLIDFIVRCFAEPGQDKIMTHNPGFPMIDFCAALNQVELVHVPLDDDMDLDMDAWASALREHHPKLTFVCTPNNPTGNCLSWDRIVQTIEGSEGIVVVDEAYVDFHEHGSFCSLIDKYPNLIVTQTLSKAWAHAAVRFGMIFAQEELIHDLKHVRLPYDMNTLTVAKVQEILSDRETSRSRVLEIVAERERVAKALEELPVVEKVFPSDANFLLVRFADALQVQESLKKQGVITRDRHAFVSQTLRISIGLPSENDALLRALSSLG